MRCVALRIAACPPAHCDVTKGSETSPPQCGGLFLCLFQLRPTLPGFPASRRIVGGWIDCRDLGQVFEHEGPLPHPAQDQPQ